MPLGAPEGEIFWLSHSILILFHFLIALDTKNALFAPHFVFTRAIGLKPFQSLNFMMEIIWLSMFGICINGKGLLWYSLERLG